MAMKSLMVVISHLSLVTRRALVSVGRCAADRFDVGVQLRAELSNERLELRDLLFGQQLPAERASQKVSRLVQRTATDPREVSIILVRATTRALGDVGTHAIGCSNELPPNRSLREFIPLDDQIPNRVRQIFR